jgi:wyosine [tRNA(Phe)-imidazoG37] synthetase (radical SAM superfamily)
MRLIYGPVPSWRLGRSLGVDPVSSRGKTCSFDCIYCQLGRLVHPLTERRVFVEPDDLRRELDAVGDVLIDTVTFSGVAEPTLAANLAELAGLARTRFPDHPLAILTNASLMPRADVRQDLQGFDIVVAKLDAPDEALFQAINQPVGDLTLAQVVDGIRRFRDEFPGHLALQMMFVAANQDRAGDMAALAQSLRPDEVQLNTPLRPCAVSPLAPAAMAVVYKARRPTVRSLDRVETRRRRPEKP